MNRYILLVASLAGVLLARTALSDALADPTRPPSARAIAASASDEPLKLQAIFAAGETRTAIVNGKVVSVGDHLNEAVIDVITQNSIHYTRHSRAYVATLPAPQRLDIRPARGEGNTP
jgi:hypothetical protein